MTPTIRLDGKVALVTGGGVGIGRAIVEAYVALGAKVVVAEIDPARAEDVRGVVGADGLVVIADVCKSADVAALAKQLEERFGRLDILVNNVGDFLRLSKKFEKSTGDDWDRLYDINLRHMFLVTNALLPLMRKSAEVHGGASIINLSSIEGFRGIPMHTAYCAFKTGIVGFTKSLAVEVGPQGIRVNCIAPETTETPQVPIGGLIPPENQEYIKRWTPLGRFGTPQDSAGCAVFLASELSAWVTGTTINLDGGALAAAGFYRSPDNRWTNVPLVTGIGIKVP